MALADKAELCTICQQINFAAIFTPREWDPESGRSKTIYRPEWNGNGKPPDLEWTKYSKKHRTGPLEDQLPRIRTADYDELSLSTQADADQHAPRAASIQPVLDLSSVKNDPVELNRSNEPREVVDGVEPDQLGHDGASDQELPEKDEVDGRDTGSSDEEDEEEIENEEDFDEDDWKDDNGSWFDDEDEEQREVDYDDDNSQDSVSTWSGHSHFTEIQRIDLDKQAQGNWSYRHGQLYYLGSLWDLRSRRHECDLCWRLWRHTRKNPDIKTEYLTKSRCILKLMELKGRRNDGSDSEIIMLNLVYIYGYKVDDPRESEWIIKMGFAMQGAHRDVCNRQKQKSSDRIVPFDDRLYGQARWKQDECDYALFREWLRVCETKHVHPSPGLEGDMSFRLVDVQQKCLVEWSGPISNAPRFIALSYVWGKARQEAMLTIDLLNTFRQAGFLNRPLDKTIRDSIELVSRLGERYLWVDALCVIQDSHEDKIVQIPHMHKIYGKAVLTIVAAYGHSADAGLPGVGESTRTGSRFKMELDDIRVTFRGNTKVHTAGGGIDFNENYLFTSMYQSRAWTYQEGRLSQRLLIFTGEQAYWECERCTWCEETHWESGSVDFIHWRAVKGSTPTDVWEDRMERKNYDLTTLKPEPPRNSYADLIKEYSSRELSHSADILDACTGVLNSIKAKEQSEFIYGLRKKHFGNDLLFNTLTAIPPRFPNRSWLEAGFPSWSWASWKGIVEIANAPRNNSYDIVENIVPCDGVKCYMLEIDSQGLKHLQLLNENGGWRFRSNYVRRGEGIYDFASPSLRIDGTFESEEDTPESTAEIPEYSQDLSLSDVERHQAFSRIIPGFHVVFNTFASTVVVRTEFDDLTMMMSNIIIAGTHKLRGGGMWENRDPVQRQVYVCKEKFKDEAHQRKGEALHGHDSGIEESSTCPCCGKDSSPAPLPENLELGPYLGRLPPLSSCWNGREYMQTVPDGIYRLLWMNNNQLPMFGHLLCKPVSKSAPADGDWDAEILQRVCGVVGPTDILRREMQEKYAAEWGTFILS